jgi:hypothetical protein
MPVKYNVYPVVCHFQQYVQTCILHNIHLYAPLELSILFFYVHMTL